MLFRLPAWRVRIGATGFACLLYDDLLAKKGWGEVRGVRPCDGPHPCVEEGLAEALLVEQRLEQLSPEKGPDVDNALHPVVEGNPKAEIIEHFEPGDLVQHHVHFTPVA